MFLCLNICMLVFSLIYESRVGATILAECRNLSIFSERVYIR